MNHKFRNLILLSLFFLIVWNNLGRPVFAHPQRDASGFMKDLDKNKDGKVSRGEFTGPEDMFRRLDRDGDGSISSEEAPGGGPHMEQTGRCGDGICGDSPFGFAALFEQDINTYKEDLGFSSIRLSAFNGIVWELNDPSMNGKYAWQNDGIFRQISQAGLELSVVVLAGRKDSGGNWKSPIGLNKLNEFSDFIKAAVERYDADGIDDAQGSPRITYWALDDEMDLYLEEFGGEMTPWRGWDAKNNKEVVEGETLEYAKLLKSFYAAVKSADPGAKVVIGSLALSTGYYDKIFEHLEALKDNSNDRFFDVFNYHSYGPYQAYGQTAYNSSTMQGGIGAQEIKTLLNKYGYGGIETIITEVSTWSGVAPKEGAQTEAQQASNLFKRYVYSIANGVSRIYWTNLKAKDGYLFGMGGLVENGNKKLAYYTYKLMVEKLSGFDQSDIRIVQEKDGVYIYKFIKNNKSIWVAWNDNEGQKKEIAISGFKSGRAKLTEALPNKASGKDVKDYSLAFRAVTESADNESVKIRLENMPVFLEE